MADVGVDVEGAVGRGDVGQPQTGQSLQQQGAIAGVDRQMAFELLAAVERGERRMLAE